MRDRDTPLPLVRMWAMMRPGCYAQLDRCRTAKPGGILTWPDYCLLPINAAHTYLVCAAGMQDADAALVSAELTACWMWRQHKVIYTFDADLIDVLQAQAADVSDSDILPADLLMHLPYPCIYIQAPGLLEHTDGFFAWVDYDTTRQGPELRIQWMTDDMAHTVAQVLHILPGHTLRDCIRDTARHTGEVTGTDPVDAEDLTVRDAGTILAAIQLIMYIVSQDADVASVPAQDSPRRAPQAAKAIRDKASEILQMDVGVRIGAAIRNARARHAQRRDAAGPGGTRRPHARRGHWHHYWTGPKDSQARRLILKWTAPTFIHADDFGGEIVAYPVRKPKSHDEI